VKLSHPSVQRNREPIAAVLADWLPASGLVLEVASGSGEHAAYFAERFPDLDWQPSDSDSNALGSIEAWRADSGLANLRTRSFSMWPARPGPSIAPTHCSTSTWYILARGRLRWDYSMVRAGFCRSERR